MKIRWTELLVPSRQTFKFSRILGFTLHSFQINDTNEKLGGYLYLLKHVETLLQTMPLTNPSSHVRFFYNRNVDIWYMGIPIYFDAFHYYEANVSGGHPFSMYAKIFEKVHDVSEINN